MKNLQTNPVRSCAEQAREMMMTSRMALPSLICCMALVAMHPAFGADSTRVNRIQAAPKKNTPKKHDIQKIDPQKQVAAIDSVVALVNDDVITRKELDDHVSAAIR